MGVNILANPEPVVIGAVFLPDIEDVPRETPFPRGTLGVRGPEAPRRIL